jgi:hypothetical protein
MPVPLQMVQSWTNVPVPLQEKQLPWVVVVTWSRKNPGWYFLVTWVPSAFLAVSVAPGKNVFSRTFPVSKVLHPFVVVVLVLLPKKTGAVSVGFLFSSIVMFDNFLFLAKPIGFVMNGGSRRK